MKKFDLPASTRLKLIKTTPRKETHGKDLVQAISLRLEWWPADNAALNLVHEGLQDMIFWTPPEVAAQCALDGIPAIKQHIRCQGVARPWKVEGSLSGYTICIDYGIDASTALELYACTLDKFEVDAKDGGASPIRFSLASNKQVTPELVGLLCGLEGTEIVATLTPPAVADHAIDGSKEAFQRDHPEFADGADPDAGDLFAGQHGGEASAGDDPASDQHAGDFGTDDTGAPGAGDSDEPNWPEPGADSEGGETDQAGDAAEFEAGAAAAIEKATGGRRGRKTRAVVE